MTILFSPEFINVVSVSSVSDCRWKDLHKQVTKPPRSGITEEEQYGNY